MATYIFRQMKLDELINLSNIAIKNSLDIPEILASLDTFNFGQARLEAGQAMLATATALDAAQTRLYSEQYQATAALQAARAAAHETWEGHRRLARLIWRGQTEKQRLLGLTARAELSLAGWLHQATTFYANALAETSVLAGFAGYNVDVAVLQAGQAAVENVAALHSAQQRAKAAAQAGTRARDEALTALSDFMVEFYTVARLALPDDERIEALGFGPARK